MARDFLGTRLGSVVDEDLPTPKSEHGVNGGPRHAACTNDKTCSFCADRIARREMSPDACHYPDPVGVFTVPAKHLSGLVASAGLFLEWKHCSVCVPAERHDCIDGPDGFGVSAFRGELLVYLYAPWLHDTGSPKVGISAQSV